MPRLPRLASAARRPAAPAESSMHDGVIPTRVSVTLQVSSSKNEEVLERHQVCPSIGVHIHPPERRSGKEKAR